MAKRGTSGISRIVAIRKPTGMSSHDVVNQCRTIFNERRVGHMGTLDPLASGVLPICIGPATRLNPYLADHDKSYRMTIEFGIATSTDDREGEIIKSASIDDILFDPDYAQETLKRLEGSGFQIPPAYSAIKVNGKKSYEQARKGNVIALDPRPFTIYNAEFEHVSSVENRFGKRVPCWTATFFVSKGTYMRSIARDLGHSLHTVAHVRGLERLSAGNLTLSDCLTLEELKNDSTQGVVDPLRLLGVRWAFIRSQKDKINNGAPIDASGIQLNDPITSDMYSAECCTSSVRPSKVLPQYDELIAFVVERRVKALYKFSQETNRFFPCCVFSIGVERGTGL